MVTRSQRSPCQRWSADSKELWIFERRHQIRLKKTPEIRYPEIHFYTTLGKGVNVAIKAFNFGFWPKVTFACTRAGNIDLCKKLLWSVYSDQPSKNPSIDGWIDRPTDRAIDQWSLGRSIDRSIDRVNVWSFDRSIDCRSDRSFDRSFYRSII